MSDEDDSFGLLAAWIQANAQRIERIDDSVPIENALGTMAVPPGRDAALDEPFVGISLMEADRFLTRTFPGRWIEVTRDWKKRGLMHGDIAKVTLGDGRQLDCYFFSLSALRGRH